MTTLREGDGEKLVARERVQQALRLQRHVERLLRGVHYVPRALAERAAALAEDLDELALPLPGEDT